MAERGSMNAKRKVGKGIWSLGSDISAVCEPIGGGRMGSCGWDASENPLTLS